MMTAAATVQILGPDGPGALLLDEAELGHWPTRDGEKVDLVVETVDGTVVGFEIKAGREVDSKALHGLIALRDSLGDQFRADYPLNTQPDATGRS